MPTISGASQYYSAAYLANARGVSPSTPNVLGTEGSTASLLDVGRGIGVGLGVGISSSARALNTQFLSQSANVTNQLLSLAAGSDSNVEGAQVLIKALRAKIPQSKLAPSIQEELQTDSVSQDDQSGSTERGDQVDIEA